MTPNDGLSNVSIVLLSHNRSDVLHSAIQRLLGYVDSFGCELIIVDNASTDGSAQIISNLVGPRRDVRVIMNAVNLGVAGGRNCGWALVTRDLVLSIDDDTIVSASDIVRMSELMKADGSIGALSPRILHAKSRLPQLDLGDQSCELTNYHGACHMIRRSVMDLLGPNDELCNFGGEEINYSICIRSAGFKVCYTPKSTALHNSIERSNYEGIERRRRRVFNYTRINYKYFPLGTATILSIRVTISYLMSSIRHFGLSVVPPLLLASLDGVRQGRRGHRQIPNHVVNFYRDPAARPDIGNVPVGRKLVKRLIGSRSGRPSV